MNAEIEIVHEDTFNIIKREVLAGRISEAECLTIAVNYVGLSKEAKQIRRRHNAEIDREEIEGVPV